MNYCKFLSPTSLARKPSAIRILTAIALEAGPSMISLAGGMPNGATFPFKEASFKMWNGDSLYFDEDRMKKALQYSASNGLPEFLSKLSEIQNHWHSSKHHFTSNNLCVTYGSTDAVSKCLDMLLMPEDALLLEQPTNPTLINSLKPLGCHLLPIASDKEGIIPAGISKACNTFRADDQTNSHIHDNKYGRQDDKKSDYLGSIKCLYTNASLPETTLERRKEVIKLANDHDFLILEHDPFYFITPSENKVASYLSLDTEARVLRIDSFSHIFSPGMRVGMVTGPEELVKRVVLHVMVSTLHCPSINQMMLYEVMNEMKIEGFNKFCQILIEHYDVRRRIALKAVNQHLSEYFEWETPKTGFTMRLRLKRHVKLALTSVLEDLAKRNVYFRNANDCYITQQEQNQLLFSFGFCDEEDIEKGCYALSQAVKQHLS